MTVRWNICEQMDSARGYLQHPAASTSVRGTNGKPLDAGFAMRVESNLGQLCNERVRNLVQSPGTGPAGSALTYQNTNALFSPLRDGGFYPNSIDVLAINGANALPWDPRVSESFLTHVIPDRQIGGESIPPLVGLGRATLPSIRFSIDMTLDATNSSSSVGFAITTHDDPMRLRAGDYLAFYGSSSLGMSGHQVVTATVSCTTPITPDLYDAWPSRPASFASSGPVVGYALALYLWFGWKFIGTGVGNAINGMCAWESRIDPA